jgi:hypothetical protein
MDRRAELIAKRVKYQALLWSVEGAAAKAKVQAAIYQLEAEIARLDTIAYRATAPAPSPFKPRPA